MKRRTFRHRILRFRPEKGIPEKKTLKLGEAAPWSQERRNLLARLSVCFWPRPRCSRFRAAGVGQGGSVFPYDVTRYGGFQIPGLGSDAGSENQDRAEEKPCVHPVRGDSSSSSTSATCLANDIEEVKAGDIAFST